MLWIQIFFFLVGKSKFGLYWKFNVNTIFILAFYDFSFLFFCFGVWTFVKCVFYTGLVKYFWKTTTCFMRYVIDIHRSSIFKFFIYNSNLLVKCGISFTNFLSQIQISVFSSILMWKSTTRTLISYIDTCKFRIWEILS